MPQSSSGAGQFHPDGDQPRPSTWGAAPAEPSVAVELEDTVMPDGADAERFLPLGRPFV